MSKKLFLLILIFFTTACQSIKDGLSGKKYENSDEFLVIKKNPLILPPDFNSLPTPEDVVTSSKIENIENEIDDLLSSIKDQEEEIQTTEENDTENFVLEKINE